MGLCYSVPDREAYKGTRDKENRMHGSGTLDDGKGNVYEGSFDSGNKHGFGTMHWKAGHYYKGAWNQNRRHGEGMFFSATTGACYEGTCVENEAHGRGIMTYGNGDIYTGQWQHDMRCGPGKLVIKESGSIYEGNFSQDKQDGFGKFISGTSSDQYIGFWVADCMEGMGKYIYRNGTVYEGEFKENMKHGKGQTIGFNGTLYKGEYYEDAMHGAGEFLWADGTSYEGTWHDNKCHGIGTMRTPNGDFYKGMFHEGEKHGQGVYTWKNGATYTGDYVMGARTGQGIFIFNKYEADGVTLSKKSIYQQGQWLNGKFIKPDSEEAVVGEVAYPPIPPTPVQAKTVASFKAEALEEIVPRFSLDIVNAASTNSRASTLISGDDARCEEDDGSGGEDKENLPLPSPAGALKVSGIPKFKRLATPVAHTAPVKEPLGELKLDSIANVASMLMLANSPRSQSSSSKSNKSCNTSDGENFTQSTEHAQLYDPNGTKPGSVWNKLGKEKAMAVLGKSMKGISSHTPKGSRRVST